MAERHLYTNRLINQKSPYLLQHAHNPVDWYPWSDEAFQIAKNSDKPIFLSIGYATCHWCHVMERESFEDPEIAKLMNDSFVNIKVDREELPEVDSLYMEFAQGMMAGAAGWPLNVILTPDLQPFFAATYLPPFSRHGLVGLREVALRIRELWHGDEREQVLQQAAQVVQVFAENAQVHGDTIPEKEQLQDLVDLLCKLADPVYGGLKGIPKFPIGYQYNFLLHYSVKHDDSRALFLVERTLDMMHRGGIYDHLGGGFSRYSVDEQWLVPHFEKMLYDNALMAEAYLEAWQLTKNPEYREVCEEILDYILHEMKHPEGGFYSAEDAESEGREGLFYTWTPHEITQVLGTQEGELFCEFYGVTEEGVFEGRSILHIPMRIEEFAAQRGLDPQELSYKLLEQKRLLWEARNKRIHPFKDDKILCSWNGLMIHTMVRAGCAFNEKRYIDAAWQAASFLKSHLWRDNQLLHRWRDGEALFNAGIDDYAFLIRSLISLFEANCGSEWLEWAIQLTKQLNDNFKMQDGAFYQTDGTDPSIILRKCQFADGAEPSGNAIHCENLLRLYQMTLNSDYLSQAEDIFKTVKKFIDAYAPGYCYHMMNLNRYYDKQLPTFVFALKDKESAVGQIRHLVNSAFIPHKAVIWRRENDERLFFSLPFVEDQAAVDNKTTLYLCHQGVCQQPINDFTTITEIIKKQGAKQG